MRKIYDFIFHLMYLIYLPYGADWGYCHSDSVDTNARPAIMACDCSVDIMASNWHIICPNASLRKESEK